MLAVSLTRLSARLSIPSIVSHNCPPTPTLIRKVLLLLLFLQGLERSSKREWAIKPSVRVRRTCSVWFCTDPPFVAHLRPAIPLVLHVLLDFLICRAKLPPEVPLKPSRRPRITKAVECSSLQEGGTAHSVAARPSSLSSEPRLEARATKF